MKISCLSDYIKGVIGIKMGLTVLTLGQIRVEIVYINSNKNLKKTSVFILYVLK